MLKITKYCLLLLLIPLSPAFIYSQATGASALRDYVGLINQTYHPGIVSIFEKKRAELLKQGENDSIKMLDIFLSGGFGSGFLYNDSKGNLYIITNNHVISQAHTLSITFKRTDGTKRRIENLRIIAVDEEDDLAILAVPQGGERPFVNQGLVLATRAIEEGEDVYSAGFPGLGATPIWQFGRGMVSNISALIPKNILDETLLGPFIQHTAQIDSGNSGGPLLVLQRNAPSGYAVAGINTLKAHNRQAANYAIPISKVRPFIDKALNPKPAEFRAELDERLEKFTEGLKSNKAVYPHIAEFLSTECVGENAEYAIEELFEKGNRTVRRGFNSKMEEGIAGAMGIAVAWTIENSLRRNTGSAIYATIKEITGDGEEYTVVFSVNNKDVSSIWIREYGNWRIRSFGTIATGDTSLLEKRQKEIKAKENLRINSLVHTEAGYAHLFFKNNSKHGVYLSSELFKFMGFNFYASTDFFSAGSYFGYRYDFNLKSAAIMPYARVGMDIQLIQGNNWLNGGDSPLGFFVQGGIKVTTSLVPGLLLGGSYQLNPSLFRNENKLRSSVTATIGYAL